VTQALQAETVKTVQTVNQVLEVLKVQLAVPVRTVYRVKWVQEVL